MSENTYEENLKNIEVAVALRDLSLLLADLGRMGSNLDEVPIEEAAPLVVDAAKQLDTLKVIVGELEQSLAERVGNQVYTVKGVGMVRAGRSNARKGWDHEQLTKAVRTAILAEGKILADENGEQRHPIDIAAMAIDEFLIAAAPSWRVGAADGSTGLRHFGIDPDDHSNTTLGPWKLDITT